MGNCCIDYDNMKEDKLYLLSNVGSCGTLLRASRVRGGLGMAELVGWGACYPNLAYRTYGSMFALRRGLQSFMEYLGQALVFVWRGAPREGVIFCFQGFLVSIGQILILVRGLGTRLSFYEVLIFAHFSDYSRLATRIYHVY